DYEMPTIKGSKVLEMLRSDAQIADTPVMFLTGKSDKQSIIDVLALKPAGYLLKSIDRKTLLETLNKFFVEQRYKK
ncbi:MAG: response regulator, partial [Lachnospiraceae bacterium]|nr:response regulator [Lachnospiraceae bacterium]